MPSKRDVQLALAPADQRAILRELTIEALASQEVQPVLDLDVIQEDIKTRVTEQRIRILGEAKADYENYEKARAQAASKLSGTDYVAWGICGSIVGYILGAALLTKPRPVYLLTGCVVAVLLGLFVFRRRIWWLRQHRLLSGLAAARERWIDILRDRALLPFILETLNGRESARYATCLNREVPPRLVERSEPSKAAALGIVSWADGARCG